MENLTVFQIYEETVYNDSSHFISFNRGSQEEVNLRLHRAVFLTHQERIPKYRIHTVILYTWDWNLAFHFQVFLAPPTPHPPNDDDNNTIYASIFSFQNTSTHTPFSPKGGGSPQRNELNKCVLDDWICSVFPVVWATKCQFRPLPTLIFSRVFYTHTHTKNSIYPDSK